MITKTRLAKIQQALDAADPEKIPRVLIVWEDARNNLATIPALNNWTGTIQASKALLSEHPYCDWVCIIDDIPRPEDKSLKIYRSEEDPLIEVKEWAK